MAEQRTKTDSMKKPPARMEPGIQMLTSTLTSILETARSLPVWLRFIVVFAVLLVVVVLSGKSVQPGLVPLLYILLLTGSAGFLAVEIRRNKAPATELSEQEWLKRVIDRLKDSQTASIYLRYFRDPDFQDDERLRDKQGQVRALMTEFSRMLLNNESRFLLVGFRQKAWPDDPKRWLVKEMMNIKPDTVENEARTIVDRRIRVIHEEPHANSSTVYLINDRYLFFNRISGEIGREVKQYQMHDYSYSVIPLLIKQGLTHVFTHARTAGTVQ